MLNWRMPQRVALYTGGLAAPVLLALSETIQWTDTNEPTGIHLGLLSSSSMFVGWTTLNEQQPFLYWGVTYGAYTNSAMGSASRLLRSSLCHDAEVSWTPSRPNELTSNATHMGWLDPGTQHQAIMTHLQAGQRIFYAIGNAGGPFNASQRSFVVPPRPENGSLRFIVAADLGVAEVDGSNWDDTGCVASPVELSMRGWDNRPAANTTIQMTKAVSSGALLTIINGDISYARGFAAIWESFFDAMEPVFAAAPMIVATGNHEANWPGSSSAWNTSSLDSGGECNVVFRHRFLQPDSPSWASYDVGPVHFVQLSTEDDLSLESAQLAWLATDLARATAGWKVVSAHRFFYVSSSNQESDTAAGRALLDGGLEQLLTEHGVDLVLTGHHHSYQRSCPIAFGRCIPLRLDGSAAAPVYVVGGHAGAGLSGFSSEPSSIIEVAIREHGFLACEANATELSCASLRSSDGSEMDSFVLRKPL